MNNSKDKKSLKYKDGRTLKTYYCKICGKKIDTDTALYGSNMCRSCSAKERLKDPKKNPNYIDGRSLKKNYCEICNKEIGWEAKRCNRCAKTKYFQPMPKCIDCGKKLKNRNAKRCRSCASREKFRKFGNPAKRLDVRKKMSRKRKGRKLTESWKINLSLSMRGKNAGKKNHFFIDGRTPFTQSIKNLLEYNNWRKQIFIRDNFTCQECGQYGVKLNNFLKEYDQFSPIEDKETLVRLAIKWKPFWNINNGKTLCEDCHLILHPSYNLRRTK